MPMTIKEAKRIVKKAGYSLDESGIRRFQQMNLDPKTDICCISAMLSDDWAKKIGFSLTPDYNNKAMDRLEYELKELGFNPKKQDGFYGGEEKSFMIANHQNMMKQKDFFNALFGLGKKYRQESILWKPRGEDKAKLVYTYTEKDKQNTTYDSKEDFEAGKLIPVRNKGEHINLNGKTWDEEYKDRGFEGSEKKGYSVLGGKKKDGYKYGGNE